MALPRKLAEFNKSALNKVVRPFAGYVPGYGVIVHTGRKSGRRYETPVNVFPTLEGYVIAINYGLESHWLRNVLAAGGCRLRFLGREFEVGDPEVLHDEDRGLVPGPVRPLLAMLGTSDFLRLRVKS